MKVTIEMIPYGYANRITKETLISLTGQNERTVREQLSELACKYPLCLSSQWAGVFRPLPGERRYVEICKEETKNRGKSIFARLRAYEDFLAIEMQPTLGL